MKLFSIGSAVTPVPRQNSIVAFTSTSGTMAAGWLGLRREAHFVEHVWFKGRWGSEFVSAMLRREWTERGGNARALV